MPAGFPPVKPKSLEKKKEELKMEFTIGVVKATNPSSYQQIRQIINHPNVEFKCNIVVSRMMKRIEKHEAEEILTKAKTEKVTIK